MPNTGALQWRDDPATSDPRTRDTLIGVGGRWEARIVEGGVGDWELCVYHQDTEPVLVGGSDSPFRKFSHFSRWDSLIEAKEAAEDFTETRWGEDEPDLSGETIEVVSVEPHMAAALLHVEGKRNARRIQED